MVFSAHLRPRFARRFRVRLILALIATLAACSYPPFDREASESLSFRRWLEREGELVEEFDIPETEIDYYGDYRGSQNLRYVPSMAVETADNGPTLALDWGVLAVARWPDLELITIEDGVFDRESGRTRQIRFTRDRFNAWDVRPAIYPGTGESGAIAYYARTDESELGTDDPGFSFDVGVFTGLTPGGTVDAEQIQEPISGISQEQDERILAVGLSAGSFAVLFADESDAAENPPVALSLFESYNVVNDLGSPPSPFDSAISIASSIPLATRALDPGRRAVGSVFFEVPSSATFFSAVGAADPFGVGSGDDPGVIAATFPAGDEEYRNLVSGIEIDFGDPEINESVDEEGSRSENRIDGFLSDRIASARENSAFAAMGIDELDEPLTSRAAGSVHHVISLPDNFAELVEAGEEPGGDESFVGYFTAARPVETSGGSEYIRVSVYRVPSEAFENGN
ncbi:MAG: hypothetical protein ACOCRN_02275 [Spirochaetia bacterium]